MLFAVVQFLVASGTWIVLKSFTDFKIEGKQNLDLVKRPFVLVANHESHLDPQLVGVVMLYRLALMPLRFMGKNELFRIPIINLIFWSLGGFKSNRGLGIEKSLQTPTRILKRGGAVMMFPEGKIISERPALGEGKRGAAMLAISTGCQVLPVALHTPANFAPIDFFFKRKPVVIRIGEPFVLNSLNYPDMSEGTVNRAIQVVMQKIADVYYQHRY